MRISKQEWNKHREAYEGYCTGCRTWTPGVEPDATGYECGQCGTPSVLGAEVAVEDGVLEVFDPEGPFEPCSPGCRGWDLVGEGNVVQKCDNCKRFPSDLEAFIFAMDQDREQLRALLEVARNAQAEELEMEKLIEGLYPNTTWSATLIERGASYQIFNTELLENRGNVELPAHVNVRLKVTNKGTVAAVLMPGETEKGGEN